MSSIPAQSPEPLDDNAVVDRALLGALAGSAMSGFVLALGSAFLGAVGSRLTRQYGVAGAAIGGSVAVAFCSLVLLRIFMEHLTPWLILACFLASGSVAAVVNWWIGSRLEWEFLRWALAGIAIGTFGGALYGPIYLAKGGTMPRGNPLQRTKEALILTLALGLAMIIKVVSRAATGAVLAGAMGGVLGSLFPWYLVVVVGGQADLKELFGSVAVLPLCGVILGAVGGGCGGLQAWRWRRKLPQPSSPDGEKTVSAEQIAAADRPRE